MKVAITRAKKNLYIFCNSGYFDKINTTGIIRTSDNTDYPEPSVISMQLSHSEVNLSEIEFHKNLD